MATQVPPLTKKQKLQHAANSPGVPEQFQAVNVAFVSADGKEHFAPMLVPGNSSTAQLEQLVNQLRGSADDPVPLTFALEDTQQISIPDNLYTSLYHPGIKSPEDRIRLVFTPQAVFRVRAVNRCSAAISGHDASIIAASFAPSGGARLATGSGDFAARIWDTETETPMHTLRGHTDWVNVVSWSPDSSTLATGSMDGSIRLWDAVRGKQIGQPLKRHTKPIMSITWEPYHLGSNAQPRLASGSKDGTVRVWFAGTQHQQFSLGSHTGPITCVRWGGANILYSSSYDRTIKLWDTETGTLVQTLQGHAARINHLALSTDHVLRTGPYDHYGKRPADAAEARQQSQARYNAALQQSGGVERVVSASDDLQLMLWHPSVSAKPVAKMHGHQKVVNHATFSPDGRTIATASFDNSVRLWSGVDGAFIATLRGHVGAVYQCAWSSDSRLLVSASRDTTLKVWDVGRKKLKTDLPGHTDQVYAVDWSPDGRCVGSGGADKQVRVWKY